MHRYSSVSVIHSLAGLEDYDRLRPLSYPGTGLFLVAFCIGKLGSVLNIREKWVPEIKHHCPKTPWLMIGLQADLRESLVHRERYEKCVSEKTARNMAKELGKQAYRQGSETGGGGLKVGGTYTSPE